MEVRFDVDPTVGRVVAIAILLMLETILGSLLVIANTGEMPTEQQWFTIILVALMQLVTFVLTFLRTGEMPTETPPA